MAAASAASAAGGVWPRVNVSLQAVAQVLLVIACGAWLAARRNLDRQALAAVSSVNWHCLIPALMWSSIVGAVTPQNLVTLYPLMVLAVLHVVLGAVLALLLCLLARLPRDLAFFTVMAASLPNCGNLPWLFMPTLIRYWSAGAEAAQQAVAYSTGLTSVYTMVVVLITLVVPFLSRQRPADTLVLPRSRAAQHEAEAEAGEAPDPAALAAAAAAAAGAGARAGGWDSTVGQLFDAAIPFSTHSAGDRLVRSSTVAAADEQQQAPDAASHQAADTSGRGPCSSGRTAHKDAGVDAGVTAAGLDTAVASVARAAPARTCVVAAAPPATADSRSNADSASAAAFEVEVKEPDAPDAPAAPAAPAAAAAGGGLRHQPYVGGDSFASHRSGSFLLQHGRQVLGSFSRSMRRSRSFVELVWTFPAGWQPQSRQQQQQRHRQQQQGRQRERGPHWWAQLRRWWRAVLAHPLVNLPLGATLVGIACAAVGPVRNVLVQEMAALHWLWLGAAWVGAASAPLATMQIAGGVKVSRRMQWAATAIACLVKLVVVPLINVVLLRTAGFSTLAPTGDSVYQFLMLVQGAVPGAVALLIVCSRVYPDVRPLSQMLFWQYVLSLFTLPAFMVWFLSMLGL